MKNTIITLLILAAVGVGIYVYLKPTTPTLTTEQESIKEDVTTSSTTPQQEVQGGATKDTTKTVIGSSVKNNPIIAYHFGTGEKELLFVGGIHAGYEWNTVLLAYKLIDHLLANPNVIPKNIKVTVIPVLNPDGLAKVVGSTERFLATDVPTSESVVISGRFNANTVDLNRNFDCNWKASGVWQNKKVSGGTSAFSEPESKAIKVYVEANKPTASVVWYSAGGGVYSSECNDGVSPMTTTLTKKFADASGYQAHTSFDFYETSGDMVNWLAKNNIPAISVLLTNHTDTEWTKNKAGVEALLNYYAK